MWPLVTYSCQHDDSYTALTMTSKLRIFDDIDRTDPSPAYDTEDSFHFLNRVAGIPWTKVRELTDEWFADYPTRDQPDLRSRYREPGAAQHYGAAWELYVYTLYRRLGYDVRVHPTLPNTRRKPDFLVTRGDASTYVECVVHLSTGGSTTGPVAGERSWIFEATNQARNSNFMVDIEIRQTGAQRPKAVEITRPLEDWLSSLHPGQVIEQIEAGSGSPKLVLHVRGWTIEYVAWPVNPDRRGEGGRLIGVYPSVGAFISNEMLQLRDLVKRKGAHYGLPDRPLAVAVLNTSGFAEDREVNEALLGTEVAQHTPGQRDSVQVVRQRDGYWRQGPPKRGARVSAVLVGHNIYPWRITADTPKLWINPWADNPMTDSPPLETYTARNTGEVHQTRTASVTPAAIFSLDPGWPGFPLGTDTV